MGCWTSSMFGPAADTLLAYQTLKVVKIKDHRLGLIYYGLILLIVTFIFGYEMLYCNDHFDKRAVSGTSRVTLRQPTYEHCDPNAQGCASNFSSLLDLPYCNVYNGSTIVEKRLDCEFSDRLTLLPNGVMAGEMLVPTHITATEETRECVPGPSNNYTCSNVFKRGESRERYVADIERFAILISHTYRRDTLSGNNNRVFGYYMMCDTGAMTEKEIRLKKLVYGASECVGKMRRMPIECKDDSCSFPQPTEGFNSMLPLPPADSAATANVATTSSTSRDGGDQQQRRQQLQQRVGRLGRSSVPGGGHFAVDGGVASTASESSSSTLQIPQEALDDGVFAIPEGDVFTIDKLLDLAGIKSLDNFTNEDGEPVRSSGTVINVEVRYSNLVPFASTFGRGEVAYEYHVSLKPLREVKDDYINWFPMGARTRTTERRNGILFVVTVGGDFGFFSIMNTMIMLAQAASMLAVATILTDKIAIYLMERAEQYYGSKYEEPLLGDDI